MKQIQFEAGEGRHFRGAVNFLRSLDGTIYAECAVPDGASDDFGYLTMKNAIAAKHPGLTFWYDGQEQFLAEDASADCEVYVDCEME